MERRLGRGLGSLLGQAGAIHEAVGTTEVPVARVRPNPHQPRRIFDGRALEELTESIRTHGVLQPVVVRPLGDGYELVAGERRFRAAKSLGLASIPAVVRADVTDEQMLELALVENVQRQDLDPIERARAFRQMSEQLSLTQEQVADRVGLKRSSVANFLRLLELPETAQQAVQANLISMGHARALLGLSKPERIDGLVERIVREGLSVRDVEAIVRSEAASPRSAGGSVAQDHASSTPPWAQELEKRIGDQLGAPVSIRNHPGFRGQIVIDYFTRADLERLCQALAPRSTI
jgi:ParB family chromosome partitioning protein